ncbi:MAG: hypothetical protein ACP6IY_03675 [Promethearchaeia archaeon]
MENKNYRKGGKDMTVIREADIIIAEIESDPIDYSEYFDINRFFIPAEIYIADREIAW